MEGVGEIRPIDELYEYWCFFKLRRAMRAICGPEKLRRGGFYRRDPDGLGVALSRGRASRLRFTFNSKGVPIPIDLYYNRTFPAQTESDTLAGSSYSAAMRPDFSIRLRVSTSTYWIHFDAKYRLDFGTWKRQFKLPAEDMDGAVPEASNSDSAVTYRRDDLHKAHAYRDSIFDTAAVYVIFPGTASTSSVFVRSADAHYRETHAAPGVGATPLRPDSHQEERLVDLINRLLSDVLD